MQVFLSVWGALGPLVGVVLGGLLTMWLQRRQWQINNKKEEYRELISTLTRSFNVILDAHTPMVAHGPEEQRAAHEAEIRALVVIRDRLFINDEVRQINLLDRWRDAVHDISTHGHSTAFARKVGELLTDIVTSAKRSINGQVSNQEGEKK